MKQWFKFMRSRTFLIGVSLFIQIVLFLALIALAILWNYTVGFFILIGLSVLSIGVALYILSKDDKPTYKLAWVVPILMFPFFGGIFYLYYNTLNFRKKDIRKYKNGRKKIKEAATLQKDELDNSISVYAENCGWPSFKDTNTTFYQTGEETLAEIIDDLKNAKEFILLQFYIVDKGKIWNSVLEILKQKVQEGVEVYFLYDDFGGYALPWRYYKKLFKEHGIKAANFNPVRPRVNFAMNFRNHRKIVVVDGKVGYTGGINLADEYANLITRYGYWLDNGIRLEGKAVVTLTATFFSDWEFRTKEEIDYSKYIRNDHNIKNDSLVIPVGDSPLAESDLAHNFYIKLITNAKKRVDISTPYLIIDPELSSALKLAAKSGIEVNILVPEKPDKKIVYMVTEAYTEELAKAGVNMYKYTPGFNHAKVFMVDNKIAMTGSTNLDFRSLYLHFENNIIYNDPNTINATKNFFDKAFKESRLLNPEKMKKRGFFYRVLQNILKGFSHLL